VRDLHKRLADLGHTPLAASLDVYDDETVALVEAFQRATGLVITGEVDEVTWARLVEAGWRLGQRLLYLARPYLRGDDVAELQVRLAQLGFNPGRIDGIFGPLLEEALRDFQRNCGVEVNGTLTRRTLLELLRVSPSTSTRNLVTDALDLAGFHEDSPGPIVLCGTSPLNALIQESIGASREVASLDAQSVAEVARFANDNDATLVLSLEQVDELEGVHLHYWASYLSYSHQGEKLASTIASALSQEGLSTRVDLTGMALPILRETRMTTLRVEHGQLPEERLRGLSAVICVVLGEVIHR
jgi:N-acetylmuramoyl-L-alanine amidase